MAARSIETVVRDLADREAIRELTHRYAHCVWTKDVAALVDLFTEDGEMDSGDGSPVRGREALRESCRRALSYDEFHPFVHNHVIELNGDSAAGVCYLDLRATMRGRSMIGSGCYDDVYARVDGDWKFRSRRLTMSYLVPLSEGWAEQAEGP